MPNGTNAQCFSCPCKRKAKFKRERGWLDDEKDIKTIISCVPEVMEIIGGLK